MWFSMSISVRLSSFLLARSERIFCISTFLKCTRIGTHANNRRTERTRRVDRNTRDVDPDDVDRDQR